MTLNYRMTMERCPNLNRGVGCSILSYEIFSLLPIGSLYGNTNNPPISRYAVNPIMHQEDY
jgi:hypothetical protein